MYLPLPNIPIPALTVYWRYTNARLRRAGFLDLAKPLADAKALAVQAGTAVDAGAEVLSEARADRDAIRDAIVDAVQTCRANLAGRAVDAPRTEPYVNVFPDGVKYFSEAALPEIPARIKELAHRLEDWLASDDVLRTEGAPALRRLLDEWVPAMAAVDDALDGLARARTRRDDALRAFRTAVDTAFGTLVARIGRTKASRLFPSRAATAAATAEVAPVAVETSTAEG